mmetsp:Transcript_25459/g.53640  ORF Transcript_25459/g.53640 Transcript_25459/m.53640 type:complete len:241 (-) Transcript_25459:28-750(-)
MGINVSIAPGLQRRMWQHTGSCKIRQKSSAWKMGAFTKRTVFKEGAATRSCLVHGIYWIFMEHAKTMGLHVSTAHTVQSRARQHIGFTKVRQKYKTCKMGGNTKSSVSKQDIAKRSCLAFGIYWICIFCPGNCMGRKVSIAPKIQIHTKQHNSFTNPKPKTFKLGEHPNASVCKQEVNKNPYLALGISLSIGNVQKLLEAYRTVLVLCTIVFVINEKQGSTTTACCNSKTRLETVTAVWE